MLAGLFLSKFDRDGLLRLGFGCFAEAFNAMGYALGGKPASIKNYMQEFDPKFPNPRHGWRNREMRPHCKRMFERYGDLSMDTLFGLLSPLMDGARANLPEGMEELEVLNEDRLENDSFSQRVITGAAAEGFFRFSFPDIADFTGCELNDVTRFGCGFDFRIQPPGDSKFIAVEVKGIAAAAGEVRLTEKEHAVAELLRERYFLCVVRNFSEKPKLSLYRNPIHGELDFTLREHRPVVRTWQARISA